MESLGAIFKEIRESNNISIEEVEAATKIRAKYLQAIEADDFDAIPGKVYAKGFVKSYARYFKIDQEPVIQELIEETFGGQRPVTPVVEEKPAEGTLKRQNKEKHSILEKIPAKERPIEDKPLNKKVSRLVGISVLFVVLLLAIGGIYSIFNKEDINNDEQNPPIVNSEQDNLDEENNNTDIDENNNENNTQTNEGQNEGQTAGQNEGQNQSVTPQEPVYDGLTLTLTLLDVEPSSVDKCWLQVTADGKLLWEETLNEGASKTIEAKESIKIKAGNAGVVNINLNGKDFGTMGSYSQVVTREYTLESLEEEEEVVYSPGATEPISGGIYDEQPTEVSNEDPNLLNTPQ